MISPTVDEEFIFYLFVWLLVPIVLFIQQSRGGRQPGFLIYTYYFGFFMSHWFGALAHASPWAHFPSSINTIIGFKYSTWALIALVVGSMLMDKSSARATASSMPKGTRLAKLDAAERASLWGLAPAGTLAWILSYTPVSQLPSMGAILSVGKQALILAICMLCWSAWERRAYRKFWMLLAMAMTMPVVTVTTSGFIGYGVVMSTTILAFVAVFYRPRFQLLLGFLVLIYGGLCIWVNYAEKRGEIRESAWGEQDRSKTFEKMLKVLTDLQPFDISNQDHLYVLDVRLNQNELVGAAIEVTPEVVPFQNGATLWMAVVAFIPRAIWSGKPEVGGSGDFVSRHTLIEFAAGTSVGMGQVLEFYINFGLPAVVIGFIILGAVLRYADLVFAKSMKEADWQTTTTVFMIGSGLLQTGGAMMEVGASCATGYVLSIVLRRALNVFNVGQVARLH